MEFKNYYEIRKRYVADALSWLGYRYKKEGYGKDTIYKFEDTEEFNRALSGLMELRNKVGKFMK